MGWGLDVGVLYCTLPEAHPMQKKSRTFSFDFAKKFTLCKKKSDFLLKSRTFQSQKSITWRSRNVRFPTFDGKKSRTFIIDFILGLCVASPLPRDAHNQPPCESRHEVWVIAPGVATAIVTPERREVEKTESFHASSKHSGQGEDLCRGLQICIEIAAAS